MAKAEKIRVNGGIKASQVRLIDENGEQVGIVAVADALAKAVSANLDLVEVSPKSDPPVCRIMDFGKLKYDKKKKQHDSKKKQHVIKIKEVRFRPRISDHDFDTKIRQASKFFAQGCKVKITVMFRGRELSRTDLGYDLAERIKEALTDVAVVEKKSALEGRRFSIMMVPK